MGWVKEESRRDRKLVRPWFEEAPGELGESVGRVARPESWSGHCLRRLEEQRVDHWGERPGQRVMLAMVWQRAQHRRELREKEHLGQKVSQAMVRVGSKRAGWLAGNAARTES